MNIHGGFGLSSDGGSYVPQPDSEVVIFLIRLLANESPLTIERAVEKIGGKKIEKIENAADYLVARGHARQIGRVFLDALERIEGHSALCEICQKAMK